MDLNINVGPPKPLSDRPATKPLSPLRKNLLAFGVPILALVGLALIFTSHSDESEKPKTNMPATSGEAAEATRAFEKLLRLGNPAVDDSLAFVDISGSGGYLIVHWKDAYGRQATPEFKEKFEGLIVNMWHQAKWVRGQGWDSRVQFVEHPAGGDPVSRFSPQ